MAAPTIQQLAIGSLVRYSTDGSTYADLGTIVSIKRTPIKNAEVKSTGVSDTAVRRQSGIPDFGEIEGVLRYSSSLWSTIVGFQTARTQLYIKIIVPNASAGNLYDREVCAGYFAEFDPYGELVSDKEVQGSFKFAIDGATTLTANAS